MERLIEPGSRVERPYPNFNDWIREIAQSLSRSVLFKVPPSREYVPNMMKTLTGKHETRCPYRLFLKELVGARKRQDHARVDDLLSKADGILRGVISGI